MIGIHQLKIDDGHCAYFIERNYGNYVIFADALTYANFSFFESRGGIYKLFFDSTSNINNEHKKYFDTYGAYAVGNQKREEFSEHLPIERMGQEFSDPDLIFGQFKSGKYIELFQRGESVLFLSDDFILRENNEITLKGENITHDFNEKMKQDYVFFGKFETDNHLLKRKLPIAEKIMCTVMSKIFGK